MLGASCWPGEPELGSDPEPEPEPPSFSGHGWPSRSPSGAAWSSGGVWPSDRWTPARRLTTRGGRDLGLSPKEFGVLETLLSADGAVMTPERLLEAVWDANADRSPTPCG